MSTHSSSGDHLVPDRKPRRPRPRCAICGLEAQQPIPFNVVRPSIADLIVKDHPSIGNDDAICRRHLTEYRSRHVEDLLERERGELSELEHQVVESLARQETVSQDIEEAWEDRRTAGEKVADMVAEFGGSWRFIISFVVVLVLWMMFNIWATATRVFDTYPFILLNLVLSCIAALQAPVIMMSQRRQEAKDRLRSENDFRVNLKAELEIRHLHEKIDHLLTHQWERLVEIQQIQLEIMHDLAARPR
jgi:uncharacterized membrane protein